MNSNGGWLPTSKAAGAVCPTDLELSRFGPTDVDILAGDVQVVVPATHRHRHRQVREGARLDEAHTEQTS